jgi:hypothetical protein
VNDSISATCRLLTPPCVALRATRLMSRETECAWPARDSGSRSSAPRRQTRPRRRRPAPQPEPAAHKSDGNQPQLRTVILVSCSLPCSCPCLFLVLPSRPSPRRPARPARHALQLAQVFHLDGPENQHDGQLLRLGRQMNIPCDSPLTSFTITSVVSPLLRSRSRTIGDHSLVSKYLRSCSISSIEYWPSLSNSYSRT